MPASLFLGMLLKHCDKQLLALKLNICLSAHAEQLSLFQQIFVKLMLYRQIITAYCENYTKDKYIVVIIQSVMFKHVIYIVSTVL